MSTVQGLLKYWKDSRDFRNCPLNLHISPSVAPLLSLGSYSLGLGLAIIEVLGLGGLATVWFVRDLFSRFS